MTLVIISGVALLAGTTCLILRRPTLGYVGALIAALSGGLSILSPLGFLVGFPAPLASFQVRIIGGIIGCGLGTLLIVAAAFVKKKPRSRD
jgi:hypothetical protein